MKRVFIPDENVIITAETGEDDRGRTYSTSFELLSEINFNCHALALTGTLYGKYSSHIDELKRRKESLLPGRVMSIISNILGNPDKDNHILSEEDLESLPELIGIQGIDEGDRLLVRIAVMVQDAIIVTTDGPFIAALMGSSIARNHNITIIRPEDAIDLAGPTDI